MDIQVPWMRTIPSQMRGYGISRRPGWSRISILCTKMHESTQPRPLQYRLIHYQTWFFDTYLFDNPPCGIDENKDYRVGFDVLTAVTMKMMVLWDVTLLILASTVNLRFGSRRHSLIYSSSFQYFYLFWNGASSETRGGHSASTGDDSSGHSLIDSKGKPDISE
jgi:hypothetical protein